MSDDVLLSAKLKIERADRHIQELESLAPDLALGAGYRLVVDHESQAGGPQLLRLEFLPPRREASAILGETIYQLRSTLDVATVAMARIGTPGCGVSDVYFPFGRDLNDLLDFGTAKHPGPQRKIKKLSDAARAVINNLHPYPGGNEALVGLNTLRNEDAHIELNPLSTLMGNYTQFSSRGGMWTFIAAQITGRLAGQAVSLGGYKKGMIVDVADILPDLPAVIDKVNEHMKIASGVVFGNSKAFEGEPVVATLKELSAVTREVIGLLERTI